MAAMELDHDDLDRIEQAAEGGQSIIPPVALSLVAEVRSLWKLADDQNTLNERLTTEAQRIQAAFDEERRWSTGWRGLADRKEAEAKELEAEVRYLRAVIEGIGRFLDREDDAGLKMARQAVDDLDRPDNT